MFAPGFYDTVLAAEIESVTVMGVSFTYSDINTGEELPPTKRILLFGKKENHQGRDQSSLGGPDSFWYFSDQSCEKRSDWYNEQDHR
jgi:hypothetical protein